MNNKIKKIGLGLLLAGVVSVTGCSTTGGYVGHQIQTQVQLNKANFKIVKTVKGEASANYFFGIGPSKQDIVAQAKIDMINKAGLRGPQAFVNITTDTKHEGFFFWHKKTTYVSAEVVEFK